MITLKYKILRNENFGRALNKLLTYPAFSTKVSIKIARIKQALDNEGDLAQKEWTKLLKNFALLDEKGDFVPQEGVPNSFTIPEEKQAAWIAAVDSYNDAEFFVQTNGIDVKDLEGVQITPLDIISLEPLLAADVPVLASVSPIDSLANSTQTQA